MGPGGRWAWTVLLLVLCPGLIRPSLRDARTDKKVMYSPESKVSFADHTRETAAEA